MAIQTINPKTAKQWLDNQEAILIDVREASEHASEKIDNAYLFPVKSITVEKLPTTDKKIIIHCQRGMRGTNACQKLLAENNNLDVYNVEGGIEAWRQAGLATIKGARNVLPLDRQAQLLIGSCVLIFGLLGYFASPAFSLGAAFCGAGLANAGLTGWCGIAEIIKKMPWNK